MSGREPGPAPGRWRHIPGLWVLLHDRRRLLRGDVLAGVTVTAYLIPQVMAYAEVAGLPAITGLWAVLLPLAVYAVLGSSRLLSIGPESTTALMTAAGVAALAGGDPARAPEAAAVLAVAVGLVCLAGWLGRLGFLANLLSRPVLVGYTAGIALLMVVGQLGGLTGVPVTGEGLVEELGSFVEGLPAAHLPTVLIGLLAVATLLVLRRWLPRAPGPLLVMVLSAVVVGTAHLDQWR
jgi:SulP family sulfate permease